MCCNVFLFYFIVFTMFVYFPSKGSEPTSDVTSPHLQSICHSYLYLPHQCLRSIYMSSTKLTLFSAPLDSLISQSKYRNCCAIFKHEVTLPLIVFLTQLQQLFPIIHASYIFHHITMIWLISFIPLQLCTSIIKFLDRYNRVLDKPMNL